MTANADRRSESRFIRFLRALKVISIPVVVLSCVCAIVQASANAWASEDAAPHGGTDAAAHGDAGAQSNAVEKVEPQYALPPPPFSEDIFPCSECHDPTDEVNREPRVLEDMHEEIVLKHDEENRWCLDCHDAQNRDQLHLASGKLVPFSESYRLCGQCHGDKYRDWRAGDHGKRTGSWNGEKQYLLCAHCHNPHAPKFKPMEPLPPPVKPGDTK